MATTRIATQPRVSRSKKSADSPHEVQANDPVFAQARAVADTIHQLERGRIPRDLPKLPLFSDDASSPAPPPVPKLKPRLRHSPTDRPSPGLARHRRKCVVCNHADREEIEEQFVQWRHPGDIAHDFQIEEARYIRRHAQAAGLYARRRENYLFTLENLLERGDEIELTASAYIKAVRAYACMCDTVRWTEPAIRVIGIRDSSSREPRNTDHDRDELCGSGLQPRHNARLSGVSFRERSEGRGSASTPRSSPAVAGASSSYSQQVDNPPSAASSSLPPAQSSPAAAGGELARRGGEAAFDSPVTAKPAPPGFAAESSKDSMDRPVGPSLLPKAAIPDSAQFASRSLHRDAPSAPLHHSQKTKDAEASPDSSLATDHSLALSEVEGSLPSNRPSPRLETGVSDRKQRKEASSNRP